MIEFAELYMSRHAMMCLCVYVSHIPVLEWIIPINAEQSLYENVDSIIT